MLTPLEQWVDECARITRPKAIHWCEGSQTEYDGLVREMLQTRTLIELNQQEYPGCYLHRSDPNDVACTEHLTFVCSRTKDDAGPNNNWMPPAEAKERVGALFAGAMRDRTMYVVPYLMGPVSSPYSQVGVEITDSPYVAASMRIVTRMGKVALDRLGASDYYVKGLHSLGDLSPDRRFILHFPEERTIWSVGSGYGGNALLGKKWRNSRFTNVALTPRGTPYWEGMDGGPPPEALDWQGRPWTPASGTKAAHPNSRFTTPAHQCPSMSPAWESPAGVPISAIVFGGRRATLMPLVFQSFNWRHGVFLGATMASETTAAATSAVGVVRQDPMAMLPFCGYNMGDYFGHWLRMRTRVATPPQIFRVNWFRQGRDGSFLWPGFGENLRVLPWIVARVHGEVGAADAPIGHLPRPADIDLTGIDVSRATLEELLAVDREGWLEAAAAQGTFLEQFGERLPREIREEQDALVKRLRG